MIDTDNLTKYLTDAFGEFPKEPSTIPTYFVIPDYEDNEDYIGECNTIPDWITPVNLPTRENKK